MSNKVRSKWRTVLLAATCLCLSAALTGCGRGAPEPVSESSGLESIFSRELYAVLKRRLELLVKLAEHPAVIEAVRTANKEQSKLSQASIDKLDKEWKESRGPSDLVKRLMTNQCARVLAEFQDSQSGFPEIFVTDKRGLIVATTNMTSDYYQADEPWWSEAWNEGRGKAYYGRIEYDDSAGHEAISLYAPVKDPETGELIGIIKAVCDIRAIKLEL